MVNLAKRSVIHPWRERRVQHVLDQFDNCTFSLYDQDLLDDYDRSLNYDWRANTGADGSNRTRLFGPIPGQVQVYRFTLTVDAPVGGVDQYRTVRFTARASDVGDLDIRRGMVVEVDSCPQNPSLETYQFIVASGLNAGAPFRRTIECEVDMARVIE